MAKQEMTAVAEVAPADTREAAGALYPVLLDLRGWECAVFGGGPMAEAKVRGLMEAGARVTVIAEELTRELRELAEEGQIGWERREPRPSDLAFFRLAIGALEDRRGNAEFAAEAERLGVLFNAVDDPAHCRFLMPSVHRQGDLIVAVSTSGKCPALAVRLRERFGRQLGPHYGRFLELAGELRARIARAVPEFEARRRLWYELVDSPALEQFERGQPEAARATVDGLIEQAEGRAAHGSGG
ncbi:MAG: bifunctional precorrin-2 dehydrogenase/sirohydrochlorin ferrochelatase [Bryobacteraceae bacterium]|nr:bifunctional precorrin-2 dehydrogenase/sirohydrochlorin ferrochelatase [Bryobacteraceae bacterium]